MKSLEGESFEKGSVCWPWLGSERGREYLFGSFWLISNSVSLILRADAKARCGGHDQGRRSKQCRK